MFWIKLWYTFRIGANIFYSKKKIWLDFKSKADNLFNYYSIMYDHHLMHKSVFNIQSQGMVS
jgi:hypothetical protein